MSDLFSTSVSGLLAFQRALDVTSNNISNVATPGYSKENPVIVRPATDRVLVVFADAPGIGHMKEIDLRHNKAHAWCFFGKLPRRGLIT